MPVHCTKCLFCEIDRPVAKDRLGHFCSRRPPVENCADPLADYDDGTAAALAAAAQTAPHSAASESALARPAATQSRW
jgi:hypothetical protein